MITPQTYKYIYSRRQKNHDVSVPSKRNASFAVCRFITSTQPMYFHSVSVLFPFCVGWPCASAWIAMRECSSTPCPCPLIARCKKILVESRTFKPASEIAIASVIKTPLFEYLPSHLSLLSVVDRSSVAGGCSVELTARETVWRLRLLRGADHSRSSVSIARGCSVKLTVRVSLGAAPSSWPLEKLSASRLLYRWLWLRSSARAPR